MARPYFEIYREQYNLFLAFAAETALVQGRKLTEADFEWANNAARPHAKMQFVIEQQQDDIARMERTLGVAQ